ncbi:MAG: tryptophan 2,3-dioxygenase family protein [Ferruginibacter sp.]
MAQAPVYYSDYLQLEKILNAQQPVSFKGVDRAHDEMLFIIIHQTYELWFKQVLYEVQSVIDLMSKPLLNDNAGDLQTIVHRLKRVATIQKLLVQQIDILETMTSMDFLDFRDLLRPASGFQSTQFKILEAKLGLQFQQRHGQQYYTSQLHDKDIALIKDAESAPSILRLINQWLERMPFFDEEKFWKSYQTETKKAFHIFWDDYERIYTTGLLEGEKNNAAFFKEIFYERDEANERALSPAACRSALFIMIYHGYPMLEQPFQLLESLIEMDNQMGNWRSRHINMVRRMIGSRIGTGGSTGAGYLQGAMEKHYIFKELAQLNSFLIDRKKLPKLPAELVEKLGYNF